MKTILLAALLLLPLSSFAQDAEEHPFVKIVADKLTNPKKRFTLIVKVSVKDGEAEKFIAAFAEAVEPTRKEDGCSRYELSQLNSEKNVFVVYERWGNLEKMKAHLATPHTKKLLETILPLLAGEPEINVLTPRAEPVKPKTAGEVPASDPKRRAEAAVNEAEEAARKAGAEIKKTIKEIEQEVKKDDGSK